MAHRARLYGATAKVGCQFFCGGLFLLLGLLFVIVIPSIWFPVIKPFGDDQIRSQVIDNAITTSNETSGYEMWATNNAPDAPPYILAASFYNLTNADEVLNNKSAVPNFQEIGPYYYVYNRTKFNIDWITDETGQNVAVTYNEYRRMGFLPDMTSTSLSPSDMITNINPAFMAVLNQAQNFDGMEIAIAGPALLRVWENFLMTSFVEHVKIERVAPTLVEFLAQYNQTDYLSTWANSTNSSTTEYPSGMTISVNGVPSNISVEIAEAIWSDVGLGLLNSDFDIQQIWYNATKLPAGSSGQMNAANNITKSFGLTWEQSGLVFGWLNSQDFTNNYLEPYILNQYSSEGLSDLTDLSYLQWASADVTYNGQSVCDLYDWEYSWPPGVALELPIAIGAYAGAFSIEQAKTFLNDSQLGMFNSVALGQFALGAENSDPSIQQTWGLTGAQLAAAAEYFAFTPAPAFGNWSLTMDIIPSGGTLIVTRSVEDWLFNATDPILLYVQPQNPKAALLRNDTSMEDGLSYAPSTYLTGYGNNTAVNDIISWEGQTELVGVYAVTVPVYGTNDWGQFPPFLTPETGLNSFSEDYMRTLNLYYNNTIYDYFDLELYRYMVDQSAFDVNPDLYQFDGFQGFANLTGGHNDTPIFLCNPHFAGVSGNWSQLIEGINPNPLNDTTVIDIEPTTGSVLHVYQASQVNIYVDPELFVPSSVAALPMYTNFRTGVLYPIVWIAEMATVNEVNAQKVRQVYLAKDIFAYGIYICFIFGLLLWLVAAAFIYFAYQNFHRRADLLDSDYESIQDR